MQELVTEFFKNLQQDICSKFENLDPSINLKTDDWNRQGGGGGITKVFEKGNIFERGGVNFSSVHGVAPEFLKKDFPEQGNKKQNFYATGVSIVIHPVNPHVPIIHMNVRYFELGKLAWFGGGIDLTPHYINSDDAAFFHGKLKSMCDHRNETRGIGGIFFDRLSENEKFSLEERFEFVKSTGLLFFPVYSELVKRNKDLDYSDEEVKWQLLRRGRYVEFNLVYDKGTKFGLETNGRTESILMSLPPTANWTYDFQPAQGSREEATMKLLKKDTDWLQ
jgi:coproporphyrinogen III oxidase